MVGVHHGQLPEDGLLQVEVVIFTVREVPLDVSQRVVDETTFERCLTQTT